MAMLSPACSNIATSLSPSPITAISDRGMDMSFDNAIKPAPLLAERSVTSR
jgi:hypothetical protein